MTLELIIIIGLLLFIGYLLLFKPPEVVEKEIVIRERVNPTGEEKAQIEKDLRIYKSNRLKEIDEALENSKELKKQEYENDLAQYEKAYAKVIQGYTDHMHTEKYKLEKLRQHTAAAIKQYRMDYDDSLAMEKYMIVISEQDKADIKILNDLAASSTAKLQQAIYRIAYNIYWQKPALEMVKNQIEGRVTGIYKITHIPTKRVYVGQSVDIANRWKTHIKRGAGIDTSVTNKLYKSMLEEGLHTFSFEIIEEVESNELTAREKYWIGYFKSKEHGYNTKG